MRSSTTCTYLLCRYLLIGPALHLIGRPRIRGREHVPRRGPVILAANHLAVLDSFYLTLAARRPTVFLAKSEYFDGAGIAGALRRRFFSALGQVPVDRAGGSAAAPAIESAVGIVRGGGAWGIHPEGTRSPDGRLYRGRTGAVRVAMETGAPLLPVAITGTGDDTSIAQWRRRVSVEILPPLDLAPFRSAGPDGVRAATDVLMHTIGSRTGQEMVDSYAKSWTPQSN
ncbi:1-acyl-sn-glycerol-3-phosphate acyltransferase [Prescottella agglutinans]|uniref:1-acyl-sn-glycerol-3-phosphate acyltransferase n=1 Tax=Prescottella agglutinans TaxID=1644129 RepID=A0A438BDQ1_9NOCA|nr:lysophospholipid acyltransferase family protein [Prescottella agglutinans]RVW09117.1 1-acyl-sn-glycerol-3-phosphate acyltransferase [Prescottella agglutinans]